jgi:hypothetical protein
MQTVDIIAKEWRDKVNGNSYFSMRIIVDYAMTTEKTHYAPFQYGYGESYLYVATTMLTGQGLLSSFVLTWCKEKGIIVRYGKQTGCKKSDVTAWGQPNKE